MFGEYRGLPREAVYIIYATILPSIALGMLYTDLSYYLTTIEGFSDIFMGTVIALMGISAIAFSIPFGILADRFGRKMMLILGNTAASLIIALFALTTDPSAILLVAVFEGLSEAAYSSAGSALLADKAGDERRTAAFSLFGFAAGTAIGAGSFSLPLVSVFEGLGFGIRQSHVVLYLIFALLSLGSTALLFRVSESKRKTGGGRGLLPRRSIGVLSKYIVAGAFMAFGGGLIVPLMARWLNLAYGIPDSISGPFIGVSNVVIGLSTLTAPWLAKKLGTVRAIVVTQAASTAFMFATPFAPNYVLAGFVYSVRAFLMNMASPIQQSMIMGLVTADERGAASGTIGALWRIPNSLSTTIGAWFLGVGLISTPFYVASLFFALSIGTFWLFFRRVKMPEEKEVG